MQKLKGYRAVIQACAAAVMTLGLGSVAAAGDGDMTHPGLLQNMGGDTFKDQRITLRGYVEGGYAWSFDRPRTGFLGYGNIFNEKSDDLTLNQVSIVLERDVRPKEGKFQVGFVFQGIFGSDAQFTHANGANFTGGRWADEVSGRTLPGLVPTNFQIGTISTVAPAAGPGSPQPGFPLHNSGQPGPENQGDILQAAFMLGIPVANGLTLEAGRFVTPWGMETVDPTLNGLYSHSYMYALSTPKTLTGITGKLGLNESWELMAGAVVGWDQAIEDNNDMPSFVGQVIYHYDENTDIVLSDIVGPEQTLNRSDCRWLFDLTAKTKVSEQVILGAEGLIGYEPDAGSDVSTVFSGVAAPSRVFVTKALLPTGKDAFWWGGAVYSTCKLDEQNMFTLVARGEYFNDQYGARGFFTEVWSATVGLNIVPFANDKWGRGLMFRPEVRYDYAIDSVFDDNRRSTQITLGADVIYSF